MTTETKCANCGKARREHAPDREWCPLANNVGQKFTPAQEPR